MHVRRMLVAAALVTALGAREAQGEPIYHIKSPSTLETEKGSKLQLPPGYFLDEETWQQRDLELRQLQEQSIRLKAENRSLRDSANDFPWLRTGLVGALGVAAGVLVMISLK